MKAIAIKSLLVFAGLSIISACKKDFLDINTSPNSPTVVTPRVLLPGAQVNLGFTQGGDIARTTAVITQQVVGGSRQFAGFQNYSFTEEDFNNLWTGTYVSIFKNLHDIDTYAKEHPGLYTNYQAVSNILTAYTLGMTTDLFGDIPYSEASQGNANLHPKYDTQEEIYNTMHSLLTAAIDSIAADGGDDADAPSNDDFVYGGDMSQWTAFAWALKARFHLHLSKIQPATAYANALDDLQNGGLTSNADNATVPFFAGTGGPWFQFINERDDIVYSDATIISLMDAKGDPRSPIFVDTSGNDFWGTPGYLGGYFGSDEAPVFLMTYAEQKFIEAEAKLMTGDQAGAQSAFEEGIQASFDQFGVDADDYLTANSTLAGTESEMRCQVIYEKYVANYLHPEAWVDLRRTSTGDGSDNCIGLQPTAGTSGIPRRFIYPTNERQYNANGVNQGSTMFSPRLWWDQP